LIKFVLIFSRTRIRMPVLTICQCRLSLRNWSKSLVICRNFLLLNIQNLSSPGLTTLTPVKTLIGIFKNWECRTSCGPLRPRQNLSWLFTRQESANRYEYKFRYLTEQHCLSNSQVPRQQMELSTTFWNAIILVKFFTFFLK
jgi:hypothetical protein